MTSAADGRTHAISAPEFDAGIWLGQGRYRAMCGAVVLVASLSAKPGPRCPLCPRPAGRPESRRMARQLFQRITACCKVRQDTERSLCIPGRTERAYEHGGAVRPAT